MFETVEIVVIASASVISLVAGWFLRNQLLKRRVGKLQKQYDEIYSLHMNLQHEMQISRQKNFEQQMEIKDLSERFKTSTKTTVETEKYIQQINLIKAQNDKLTHEKNELLEEITKYQNENFDLSDKINIMSREMDLLSKQNKQSKEDSLAFRQQEEKLKAEAIHLRGEVSRLKLALAERKRQEMIDSKQPRTDVPIPEFQSSDLPPGRSESQSTARFDPEPKPSENNKKKSKDKEDITSTGMRLLKEFEQELRNNKTKKEPL